MKNLFSNNNEFLTAKEAAKLLKVSVGTIKNYIYRRKLKSFKTPGGQHRILKLDLFEVMGHGGESQFKETTDNEEIIRQLVNYLHFKRMKKYELAREIGTRRDNLSRWLNRKNKVSKAWLEVMKAKGIIKEV